MSAIHINRFFRDRTNFCFPARSHREWKAVSFTLTKPEWTRRHFSWMPTARFPIVHSEQVWTCRGSSSLYSEVPSWKSLNISKGTRVLYWDPPSRRQNGTHTHDWKHDLRHWRAVKIDSLYHIFTERSRLRKTEENNSYSHSFSVTSPLLLFPSTIVRCCSIPGTEVQTLIYFWGKTTTFPHPDPYDQRYKRHSLTPIHMARDINGIPCPRFLWPCQYQW